MTVGSKASDWARCAGVCTPGTFAPGAAAGRPPDMFRRASRLIGAVIRVRDFDDPGMAAPLAPAPMPTLRMTGALRRRPTPQPWRIWRQERPMIPTYARAAAAWHSWQWAEPHGSWDGFQPRFARLQTPAPHRTAAAAGCCRRGCAHCRSLPAAEHSAYWPRCSVYHRLHRSSGVCRYRPQHQTHQQRLPVRSRRCRTVPSSHQQRTYAAWRRAGTMPAAVHTPASAAQSRSLPQWMSSPATPAPRPCARSP